VIQRGGRYIRRLIHGLDEEVKRENEAACDVSNDCCAGNEIEIPRGEAKCVNKPNEVELVTAPITSSFLTADYAVTLGV
jgi:predicted  nucleic acid-binding Zn-ribbon protein